MHIDPKSTIAGRPTLEIRRLLRQMDVFSWSLVRSATFFKISGRPLQHMVNALSRLGYIEADPRFPTPY